MTKVVKKKKKKRGVKASTVFGILFGLVLIVVGVALIYIGLNPDNKQKIGENLEELVIEDVWINIKDPTKVIKEVLKNNYDIINVKDYKDYNKIYYGTILYNTLINSEHKTINCEDKKCITSELNIDKPDLLLSDYIINDYEKDKTASKLGNVTLNLKDNYSDYSFLFNKSFSVPVRLITDNAITKYMVHYFNNYDYVFTSTVEEIPVTIENHIIKETKKDNIYTISFYQIKMTGNNVATKDGEVEIKSQNIGSIISKYKAILPKYEISFKLDNNKFSFDNIKEL